MKPIQALQLLDQASALAPLNRAAHIEVQNAVKLIEAIITEKDVPKGKVQPK